MGNKVDRKSRGGPLGEWEGIIVKSSYTFIHLLIYVVLAVRSGTDLNKAFKEHDYFYLLWTHSIFISTFIIYFIAGLKTPGYLDDVTTSGINNNNNSNNNSEHLDNNHYSSYKLKRSDDELENHNYNNNEEQDILDSNNTNEIDNELDQLLDKADINSKNSNNNEESKDSTFLINSNNNNNEDQPFCNICKHYVILRSKHCKRCNRCILKYDHHCFFMGGCIGQYNHKYFCLFLVVQLVLLSLGLKICLTGIHSEPTWKEWVLSNLVMWFPTMLVFAMMFMPIGLLGYHTYLIVTNQTSWEAQKHKRITYLRKCKVMKYPFSKGLKENLINFWTDNYNSPYWSLPTPSEQQTYLLEKKKKKQTLLYKLWKNDYYSCC